MIIQYLYQNTGINLDGEQQSKLDAYCDFLLEENEKYNLTAITEREAVWEKHFADSILGSVLTPQKRRRVRRRLRSGIPPLSPLKIARPDLAVTLVDSLQKRVEFCRASLQRNGHSGGIFPCPRGGLFQNSPRAFRRRR